MLIAAMAILAWAPAKAATVDFETGFSNGDVVSSLDFGFASIDLTQNVGGVTSNQNIVGDVGEPVDAFFGEDADQLFAPDAAEVGDFFIGQAFFADNGVAPDATLAGVVSGPVRELSFDVLDLDRTEAVTATVNGSLGTQVINIAPQGSAGNGLLLAPKLTLSGVGFISSFSIVVTSDAGIGLAFDNISAEVPVPATLPLLVGGLGLAALIARRRRKDDDAPA
ncbi:MAG: PEP-CTERM sorting domain-containing protein [Pseudomonadota bacterium]